MNHAERVSKKDEVNYFLRDEEMRSENEWQVLGSHFVGIVEWGNFTEEVEQIAQEYGVLVRQ